MELELKLTQSHVAQKPMLRGEVGARALRVRSDVRGHGQVRLCKALGCGRCGCLKPIRACCVVGSAFFFACLTRARRVCTSSQARKEAWASAGGRRPRSANKRDTASEGARSGRRWSRLRLSALANISWHLAGLSPFAPVGRRGRHQGKGGGSESTIRLLGGVSPPTPSMMPDGSSLVASFPRRSFCYYYSSRFPSRWIHVDG